MRGVDEPRTPEGLMVLVLWIDASGRVLVRISRSTSPHQPHPKRSYASTKSEVLRVVEAWLDRFVTPP